MIKYSGLTIAYIRDLSPEQILIGIEIEAHRRWKAQEEHFAYRDWEKAWRQVRTEENPYPKDEEIRPAAYDCYVQRIERQLLCDWTDAIEKIQRRGNPYPTEGEIRQVMEEIAAERTKREEVLDWLGAEQDACMSGRVWVPLNW